MGYLEAIILGIVQGLTEFLPSAVAAIWNWAKCCSVTRACRKRACCLPLWCISPPRSVRWWFFVAKCSASSLGSLNPEQGELVVLREIILSMIPAAMVGVLFADELERLFDRQVLLVGAMLLVTGFLLIAADRPSGQGRSVTTLDAMIVGLAQAFAILPGISRSGATISCSVLLGIRRQMRPNFRSSWSCRSFSAKSRRTCSMVRFISLQIS